MKKHLKRLAAAKTWPIMRKTSKFITRPRPGGHSHEMSMPLNIVIRDMLKYCETAKEAKSIVKNKTLLIDGKRTTDERRPLGVMDTLSIPETKEAYRMLVNTKGKLYLKAIAQEKSFSKVCRINQKSIISKGMTQLGMHDGRTIRVKDGNYKTGDSLLLNLPDQKVQEHLSLDKKSTVYLTGGKHTGSIGTVEDVKKNSLALKIGEDVVETLKKFAVVVGKDKPLVEL